MSAHDTTLMSSEPPKVKWVRKRGSNNNFPIYYSKEVKTLNPFEPYFLAECKRLIIGKARSNPGKTMLVGFKLFYKQRVLRGSRWHRVDKCSIFFPTEVDEETVGGLLYLYRDILHENFIQMKIDLENHKFCEKGCKHKALFCNFTNFFIYFSIGGEKFNIEDM